METTIKGGIQRYATETKLEMGQIGVEQSIYARETGVFEWNNRTS